MTTRREDFRRGRGLTAAASLERSVRREWLFASKTNMISRWILPAAAGDLHRILGAAPRQRLAGLDNVHAVRGLLTQLTLQHAERCPDACAPRTWRLAPRRHG